MLEGLALETYVRVQSDLRWHVHAERLALETYICTCRAERLALACMCIQSAWR